MVVVDIGANFGYYTLIAANLVGPTGRIYAFEPDPSNYSLLIRNIEANGFHNVTAIQKAVSNTNSKGMLHLDAANLGAHTLCESNIATKSSGCIEVEVIALDDFFSSGKQIKVDFIKIDAQGSECLIIEGTLDLINRDHPKIFIEFWPRGLRNIRSNPEKLLKMLEENNYLFGVITQGEINKMKDIHKIVTIAEKSDYINLFLE